MKEVWITSKEAAQIMQKDITTIQKNIKKNNSIVFRYAWGHGYKGKKIEILLSSLPPDAQARYRGLNKNLETLDFESSNCTGKQRTDANLKAYIVDLYQKSGMRLLDFLEWYNGKNGTSISQNQLYAWLRKLRNGGTAALIDKRGGHNKGEDIIPPEVWDFFYALYMTQQKRGVQLCYDYTKKRFSDIPSISTFRRKVKKINKYALTYYREGEKAFNDLLPYMERDKTDINSNDIWFSDHHLFDVFVNVQGKVSRLWLSVFFDARSSKVISHVCRSASANARIIKECLCDGIIKYGIPTECYFDNGKDYKEKSFDPEKDYSIFRQLGINPIYATPYHGQAKTVERFFRTLEERFGKMFPTYTGKDAKQRPECMKKSNKKIIYETPDIDTFLKLLGDYIDEYNTTPSRASGLNNESPEETYYKNLVEKREIRDFEQLRILCGESDFRIVQRNGIHYRERWYSNFEKLLPYIGEKVRIYHLPQDMDVLSIFTEDMVFICKAEANVATPFRKTTSEDYERAKKAQKEARKRVRENKPVMELDTMHIIAEYQRKEKEAREAKLLEAEELKNPDMPVTQHILPAFEHVSKTDADIDRSRKGESTIDQLLEIYGQELKEQKKYYGG